MDSVKIGILGYANIAQKAIIPAVKINKHFNLHGVASRNTENKAEVTKKLDCKFYNSYQSMVTDPEIDALYVPLPNALHFEWAKLALNHGKHLLVEKSLACTLDEVKALNQIAKDKDLALLENFQFRQHSQLKVIKEILESHQIGDVRAITSSFGFPPFPDKNNIRYNKKLGGGALLDAGAYPIKLAQELCGLDLSITAAVLNFDNNEVDIWGAGMLQNKRGQNFVQFSFGFDNYYQCNLEVWGSKGKLFTNRIFTAPPDYEPTITIENKEGIKEMVLQADNHYIKMLEYFYECIHNTDLKTKEYEANINQARLINDFLNTAQINN
jgi:NDP-hexose-3-ketoreductase